MTPEHDDDVIFIVNDGMETEYSGVRKIEVSISDTHVQLMRFKNYDFWNKVKTKFL